jgi:hypothetical protein
LSILSLSKDALLLVFQNGSCSPSPISAPRTPTSPEGQDGTEKQRQDHEESEEDRPEKGLLLNPMVRYRVVDDLAIGRVVRRIHLSRPPHVGVVAAWRERSAVGGNKVRRPADRTHDQQGRERRQTRSPSIRRLC